jgi:F-type H+-transporting ATPase subunit b
MPLGIDFVQIFLHMFNVVVLFGGLYVLLYSPVKKFMNQREEHYKQVEEETNKALKEANRLQEEHQAQLDRVTSEIAQEKQKAAKELQDMRSKKVKEAHEEASRIISKAEADAQRKRKEIVDGAKEDISGLIAEAADKLLLDGDTEKFFDAFLDEAERGADNG